jgi:DNA end-binding protein Ku
MRPARVASASPSGRSTRPPASKASEFDPATFRDRYEEALLAHLKAKQAGAVPERRKTFAPPRRVVNLMEALRRSVAEDTKGAAARKGASATPARKRA